MSFENRNLAKFPQIFNESGKIVFTGLRSGFENWLNDNVFLRETALKINSKIDRHIFKQSPTDMVVIGEDDWLFFTGNDNLKISYGTYPLTEHDLEKIASKFQKINDILSKQEIEFVFITAPSKTSIYPEKLNKDYKIIETPCDILTKYLQENTNINVIELKNDLLTAKREKQVYFKTDTHWNEVGAYEAYKSVIYQLNKFGFIDSDIATVTYSESERIGDLTNMIGSDLTKKEIFQKTSIVTPNAIITEDETSNKLKTISSNKFEIFRFINPNSEGKKCLMLGDSMFASWNLPQLMSENFSEFTYIWSWNYNFLQKYVDETKPDIVIIERIERCINLLK